jgi:hypothetical protein
MSTGADCVALQGIAADPHALPMPQRKAPACVLTKFAATTIYAVSDLELGWAASAEPRKGVLQRQPFASTQKDD